MTAGRLCVPTWFLWQSDWGTLQVEPSGKFDDYPQFWLLRFIFGALPAGSMISILSNGTLTLPLPAESVTEAEFDFACKPGCAVPR